MKRKTKILMVIFTTVFILFSVGCPNNFIEMHEK